VEENIMGAYRWRGTVGLLLLMLTACTHPPVRELRSYTEAFSAARVVSDVLYDDMAVAQRVESERKHNSTYPAEFDPKSELSAARDIQARRRALDVVVTYNEVLLKLAEGRTVDDLRAELGPLQQNVSMVLGFIASGVAPMGGLVLNAIGTALEAAERARSQAEFKRAILAGYDDVLRIIDALIDDTKALYAARKAVLEFPLNEVLAQAGAIRQAMVELARKYRLPPPSSALAQGRTNAEQELNRLFKTLQPGAPTQSLPSATSDGSNPAPVYSAEVTALLMVQLEHLHRVVEHHQQGVKSINAYHRTLHEYVLLLDRVRQALVVVKAAVEAPESNAVMSTTEVLEFALDMKNQAQAILAAYRRLRVAD
jgi:hypothetical protein